jgi:hypothetical protein
MWSPGMLLPWTPDSMENRDLGRRVWNCVWWTPTVWALFGGLQKPMVLIMPKSKDRFVERRPMKVVQP